MLTCQYPCVSSLLFSHVTIDSYSCFNDDGSDDSSYDVLGLDMETVDLTDEGEELGGNVDIINNNELHALSLRVQNFRSLKVFILLT